MKTKTYVCTQPKTKGSPAAEPTHDLHFQINSGNSAYGNTAHIG